MKREWLAARSAITAAARVTMAKYAPDRPRPRNTSSPVARATRAATLLAALVALATGLLVFRGRGLSGAYFAIVTLAAAVIAERAASHSRFIGGFNGLLDVPPLRYGGDASRVELLAPMPVYYVMLGAAGLAYGLLLWLERSPLGTTLRAVRDNEPRTAYFGFEVSVYKTFSFALSGAMAGFAGGLFATQFGFVSPALIGVPLSTEVLI